MNALTFFVVVCAFLAIKELVSGLISWRRRRRIEHLLRVERTQSHFAVARNDLVQLALSRELDANSATFRFLYFLNTCFMRRPDSYPAFSALLLHRILKGDGSQRPDPQLMEESGNWTPAIRSVVKASADAMNNIVFDYSLLMRLVRYLERRSNPHFTSTQVVRKFVSAIQKKEAPASDMRRTQKAMYDLCQV